MATERAPVTRFATMMTQSSRSQPYRPHRITPIVKITYMPRDSDLVSCSRSALTAWGTNETVVRVAAA